MKQKPKDKPGVKKLRSNRVVGRLTASQKVELFIKEAIFHGSLKPRERIIEVELAEQIGCSRAPVREAVLRLAREGLIVTIPRRGVFVRDFSVESIEEIFQMRAKLESLCVVYMRKRASPKETEALSDALETLRTASLANDAETFLEADMNLHRTIWKLSGSKELYRTLNSMMIPFILMVARSTTTAIPFSDSVAHHAEYVDLVLHTPLKQLEHAVEEYFMTIYDRLFRASDAPRRRGSGTAIWLLSTDE